MHKVAQLTSAHPRNDTRIFHKMCCSLARADYNVSLVVADGLGQETIEGVEIVDIGYKPEGRISRMTLAAAQVYFRARKLKADLYHLHDPELIPFGILLRLTGNKVVFDAHEDLPKQVLSKDYLAPLTRRVVSKLVSFYEKLYSPIFSAIIGATPSISEKFAGLKANALNVNNYPILGELTQQDDERERADEIAYVGVMHRIRGIKEVIEAMSDVRLGTLNLVGTFSDPSLEEEVRSSDGWNKINELGFLDRKEVSEVLGRSRAGIVTFYAAPNHLDAQPNKLFEYMSAGLPVVASHFPRWREIVEDIGCGICVDPKSTSEIAEALNYLLEHPEEAERMGQKGLVAINERFNWQVEEGKLLDLYKDVLK